ncbi:hypothetical protein [Halorussus caseinilyticus]|uniref:Right handed beta helix domain-containing protein n=1 Tax=Halorussus caseinilyticus TaxID=3034025 RepID=A0ABD5WID3_9EURY
MSLGLSAGVTIVAGSSDLMYVEDDISEDTTWTAAGGPYRIAADVTVEKGTTLRIEPGAVVQSAEDITIAVEGNLTAEGTASEPVTFTTAPQAPAEIRWASIEYDGASDSRLSLSHVTIERATNGITVASGAGKIALSETTVRNVERNGIRVADTSNTPKITVEDSAFAEIGERAVALTPGTGTVRESDVAAQSNDLGEQTMHRATATFVADVTMDSFRVGYRGHGNASGVKRGSIKRLGIDTDGDERVDRSLKPAVRTVGHPGSNAFRIRFNRSVTVPAGATLVAIYGGVTNPETYGTYPVAVSFERAGVEQTAGTRIPFDIYSSAGQRFGSEDAKPSRTGRLSITGTTFDAIGDRGVFVAADAARRLLNRRELVRRRARNRRRGPRRASRFGRPRRKRHLRAR